MGQPQQEIRRAALEAFKQSLEQLQQTLEGSSQELPTLSQSTGTNNPREASSNPSMSFDLHVWEEAIADIEQFIQQRQTEQS
jgi:hypothetical protein